MSKINEYCGKDKLVILEELRTGQKSLSGTAYKYNSALAQCKQE